MSCEYHVVPDIMRREEHFLSVLPLPNPTAPCGADGYKTKLIGGPILTKIIKTTTTNNNN